MDRDEAVLRIKQFLSQETGVDFYSVTHNQNLVDTKLIDSLKMLSLVSFIEELSGRQLDDEDLDEENFVSLGAMADLALRKIDNI